MKRFLVLFCLSFLFPFYAWGALTEGSTYTITLSKVNSSGGTTDVGSTTAVADSNGKISFSFSQVPTNSDANFLVVTVKDSSGTTVRQSLAPAPPASNTNSVGVNSLSYAQSKAMLQGFQSGATDDPIYAAFGFVLLRQPGLSDADILKISTGGRSAILGSNGFVSFLTNNGVTAAQLTTFRQKLIYNNASGAKALPDFAAKFKTAVENSLISATTATQDMAQAGGYMGDIFIDAANAAGIDLSLIAAAFDAAGGVADSDSNLSTVSSSVGTAMSQAMSSFFTRVASSRIKREYTAGLTLLNATGDQVTRFNNAVTALITAYENNDATYGKYFEDPVNNPMTAAIRAQMDAAFQSTFTTFQTNIASTSAEITSMRQSLATALGININTMPATYGTMVNETGTTINWPIPQAVLNNWASSIIQAGGSLTYTRDTIAIPSMMSWFASRTDFVGQGAPASLATLMGLEEDVRVIEFSKFALFANSVPSRAQEQAAELLYQQRLSARVDALDGTTNGTTAISAEQKKAIVKMMIQPSLH